ncbi:serine/threonine-protein kinase nemo [Dermatophagoides farinae]|nr:serine/threonine-protein kinase NLK2-like [Dermatophagoides farinae]
MVSNAQTSHHHHHHHRSSSSPSITFEFSSSAMLSAAAAAAAAQSYYALAAVASSTTNNPAIAGTSTNSIPGPMTTTPLLVHHPDYHQHHHQNNNNNHHSVHSSFGQNTNNHHIIRGGYHHHNLVNNNHIHDSSAASQIHPQVNNNGHHHSNGNNNGSVVDLPPDRPIGYGAFGVVWSVTDPRDGKRVALKKMPNVFQNLISSKRVFREIKMLSFFKHDNVLSALDILQPPLINFFQEIYVITELMESDLHKIIVSSQPLTPDHIKVFLYQMLRGLKYLHSAKILHRDIKPGNLLVNSNCLLKICDFGLARVEENDRSRKMTQEVVTQYYRAPELLMGAKYYHEAIDMWSIGCIFAELLGRRILFQAQTPIQQLELITDLLGTPSLDDMRYACEAARLHVLRQPIKLHRLSSLTKLSNHANNETIHLLCQMLTFNPDKRINSTTALNHPYLSEGRARYHSCMCKCCYTVNGDTRRFCNDLEPISPHPFDNSFEKELTSVQIVKERLHKEIMQRCLASNQVPLCINPLSASFKNFASSTVAHPSELPPSPHCWE